MRRIVLGVFGFFALVAVAGFIACNNSDVISPQSGSGVSVYLTDAPLDLAGVHAINATLSSVILYPSGATGDAGGIALDTGPIALPGDLKVNLLDFQNGKVALLGSTEAAPKGSYNRIRLEVVSVELVLDDDADPATPDVVQPVVVPSSKIDVLASFDLTGQDLAIKIDFDGQASIQVTTTNGKNTYLLRPVIHVVEITTMPS